MGEMEVIESISNKNASYLFKGIVNTDKYHEFVISITNLTNIEAYTWRIDVHEINSNRLQLMLLCLVISNHLSSADRVEFILSKEQVKWIKWFEPVWSSRIKYEVIS